MTMNADLFWDDLRSEIQSQSVSNHPLYKDLVSGSLQRETIAELCAQLKYAVLDGISSLSMIIPQAPRHIKKELAANLFGELCGTAAEPSHWELALKAGAAAGFSEANIDARPIMAETKLYPDTVSVYAAQGGWLEALSYVSLGIEDMFTEFCDGVSQGLIDHYGYSHGDAFYFYVHVGADEAHAQTGWDAARDYAEDDAHRQRIRVASLEGRNMWWNMYSAVYDKYESKTAPRLRLDG
jgi:pyrroloquinoline quinone (PQQ) biosynthesis protein C